MVAIQRSTLASALYEYIRIREKQEKEHGYTSDSGYLRALREFAEGVRNNEWVSIEGACE